MKNTANGLKRPNIFMSIFLCYQLFKLNLQKKNSPNFWNKMMTCNYVLFKPDVNIDNVNFHLSCKGNAHENEKNTCLKHFLYVKKSEGFP